MYSFFITFFVHSAVSVGSKNLHYKMYAKSLLFVYNDFFKILLSQKKAQKKDLVSKVFQKFFR